MGCGALILASTTPRNAMSLLLPSAKRIQLVIIGADIDYPVSHRWRGVDHIASAGGPQGLAGRLSAPIRLEGIQLVIKGAHIDHSVGHRWRRADRVAGSGVPCLYQRRNRCRRKLRLVGVEATMLGIEAKLYAVLHNELIIGRRCQC